MTNAPTALRSIERTGTGRYRVPSDSRPGIEYAVQLDMVSFTGGVCTCQGYESAYRKGNACKHLRAAIAAELEHTKMTTETESTALATRDRDVPPAALVVGNPGTALLPSRDDMKLMTDIAKTVFAAGGSMVPKHITSAYQALAVMIAGHELGLRPMTALRHVYIVNGKTEIETRAMVGIIKARDGRIQFEWPEYTQDAVTCVIKRQGQHPVTVRYTRDHAKASGQLGKGGPWATYTRDMLYAAATKRACRLACPDIINAIDSGMSHTVTEAEYQDVTPDSDPLYEVPAPPLSEGIPPEAFNPGDDGSMPVETQAPTSTDQRTRLRDLLTEAKSTTDAAFWTKLIAGIKETYPEAHNASGGLVIGKLTDEQVLRLADGVALMIHGDEPPVEPVQAELVADDEAI